MLLDISDASHAVERCREVCRRKETSLVDVDDWDCESRDNLRACGSAGTTVACSSGRATRELMSNESHLLDFLAAARNSNGNLERKTIAKFGVSTNVVSWGRLSIAKSSTQLRSIVPRWRRRISWTRWESMTLFRDPMLRRKDSVSFTPGGSQSTRDLMILPRYVPGGSLRNSVVVAVINTSTSQRYLIWRAESEDVVVAVFDVRPAYFYAKEKRDTFVELPDYVPSEFWTTHDGKLRKALYGTRQQHHGEVG